jgi:histidinol dehydrogenase
MKVLSYPQLDTVFSSLLRPAIGEHNERVVEKVIGEVATRGDKALFEISRSIDGVLLNKLSVQPEEFAYGAELTPANLKESIDLAIRNIHKFHSEGNHNGYEVLVSPGVKCWRKYTPIERVGIYVPSGSAPLFSSLYMAAIPAKIAGVSDITVCVPPLPDGSIHPSILYTAQTLGLTKVFKVGGPAAIAALAFGTESIPKVDLVVGPGSPLTALAKQLLASREIAIDIVAGASEVLVIADVKANPQYVASDLLAQAEHGASSQAVVISNSKEFLDQVLVEVDRLQELLPRDAAIKGALQNSYAILVSTLEEALEISNFYAPEHLIIATANAHELANRVRHAGSVFIGELSAEVFGDYASGTNHILPTGGWARRQGGVAVSTFLKAITFQEISREGFESLSDAVVTLAESEGLTAHAQAIKVRML